MKRGTIAELLDTIEEQSMTIKLQADRIKELSALLLQHCEVERAELESLIREEENRNEIFD